MSSYKINKMKTSTNTKNNDKDVIKVNYQLNCKKMIIERDVTGMSDNGIKQSMMAVKKITESVTNMKSGEMNSIINKVLSDNMPCTCGKCDSKTPSYTGSSSSSKEDKSCDCLKFNKDGNDFTLDYKDTMDKIKHKDYFKDLTVILTYCLENNNYKILSSMFENIRNFDEKKLYMIIAQHYKKQNDTKNMIINYKKAIEQNSVQGMIILGMYYLKNDQFEDSKKYLDMAHSKVPTNEENKNLMGYVLNCIAQFYEKMDNDEKMIECHIKSTENGNIISMKKLGEMFFENGDYVNAEIYLKMLLEKNNYDLITMLGLVYKTLRNQKKLVEIFKIGESKDIDGCVYNLGVYYYEKKFYNKSLSKLLEFKDCDHSDTLTYIGGCYENKSKLPESKDKSKQYNMLAKTYYNKAITLGGELALEKLGEMLENEKEYELCENYYYYAYDNNFENACKVLARYFHKRENPKKMLWYIEKGIEEGDFELMYEMSLYQESIGKKDIMIEYLEDSCNEYYMSAVKLLFYSFTRNDTENVKKYREILTNIHNFSDDKIVQLLVTNICKI